MLESMTIERDFGWMFFYGSKHPEIRLLGNAPIIIEKLNGALHVTGTGHPPEFYLDNFAKYGTLNDEEDLPWVLQGITFEEWFENLTGVRPVFDKLRQGDSNGGLRPVGDC